MLHGVIFTLFVQAPHIHRIQTSPERVPAFAMAEIAFLVSLTSSDKGVSQLAAQGLRSIARAEQSGGPTNAGISDEERSRRHPIYEEIGDPSVIVVSECSEIASLLRHLKNFQAVLDNKNDFESYFVPSPIHLPLT